MSAKVPPPPCVTQRLGYCPSQRLLQIGIGRVVVVVRIGAAAMAAQQAHIVDQRIGARLPQHADGARIDAAGRDSEAADDVGAARGRRNDRLGRAHALEARRAILQVELGQGGMQPDEHRVRLQA